MKNLSFFVYEVQPVAKYVASHLNMKQTKITRMELAIELILTSVNKMDAPIDPNKNGYRNFQKVPSYLSGFSLPHAL